MSPVQAKTLKQKKKYIYKEPKSFNISHEASLLFRELARDRHLGIGDLLEVLAQEEASRRLPDDTRAAIKERANTITQKRLAEVEELEQHSS